MLQTEEWVKGGDRWRALKEKALESWSFERGLEGRTAVSRCAVHRRGPHGYENHTSQSRERGQVCCEERCGGVGVWR